MGEGESGLSAEQPFAAVRRENERGLAQPEQIPLFVSEMQIDKLEILSALRACQAHAIMSPLAIADRKGRRQSIKSRRLWMPPFVLGHSRPFKIRGAANRAVPTAAGS